MAQHQANMDSIILIGLHMTHQDRPIYVILPWSVSIMPVRPSKLALLVQSIGQS